MGINIHPRLERVKRKINGSLIEEIVGFDTLTPSKLKSSRVLKMMWNLVPVEGIREFAFHYIVRVPPAVKAKDVRWQISA